MSGLVAREGSNGLIGGKGVAKKLHCLTVPEVPDVIRECLSRKNFCQ